MNYNRYIPLRLLRMVTVTAMLLVALGAHAADTRGDSLYNEASANLQTHMQQFMTQSLSYQHIPAIHDYLQALSDEGAAASQSANEKRARAKSTLDAGLYDVHLKRTAARTEYERKVNECLAELDYEGIKQAESEFKQKSENYDAEEQQYYTTYSNELTALAADLNSTDANLQLRASACQTDAPTAHNIYQKCLEAHQLWEKASDAQRQSEAGTALARALDEADALLNGAYTAGAGWTTLLQNLTQQLQWFTATAITTVTSANIKSDVYALSGRLLLRNVTQAEAAARLPQGWYIISGSLTRLP